MVDEYWWLTLGGVQKHDDVRCYPVHFFPFVAAIYTYYRPLSQENAINAIKEKGGLESRKRVRRCRERLLRVGCLS